MLQYLLQRLLQMVPVLVAISLLSFLIFYLDPVDPVDMMTREVVSEEVRQAMRDRLGLDRPAHIQYLLFVERVFSGDLGFSYRSGRPVLHHLVPAALATIHFSAVALLFTILIGIPAGMLSATRPYTAADSAVMTVVLVGVSAPEFWIGIPSCLVLALFVMMALLSPVLPIDPYRSNFAARLHPPSLTHVLGTDQLGRDLLARMIAGSGIALTVGFVSVAVGLVVGGLLGLIAGFLGGSAVDSVIMRAMDVMLAFPWLLLVIAVIAVLGPSIPNVMIAIGITLIPEYARVVRSAALSVREQDFVLAAEALGASQLRIMALHVLPHCHAHLIVLSTIKLGRSILAEAGVSYLGLGVQPPHPSWGSMISAGQDHLLSSPHLSIVPGLAVMFLVMALNIVGDGLRDALDPRNA